MAGVVRFLSISGSRQFRAGQLALRNQAALESPDSAHSARPDRITLNHHGTIIESGTMTTLKNDNFLRHEAWAIARALMDQFDVNDPETGIVAGIVRDPAKNVPSSYQPISSLNDNKEPINYINVRLEPGGLIYEGDNQNNGFYFFDEIPPGEYTVIFNAENYLNDSAVVTVEKNKSVFADIMMILVPNYDTPQVLTNFPADGSEWVSNLTDIIIEFDIMMDTTSTQNAFTVSPSATGNFNWEHYIGLTF